MFIFISAELIALVTFPGVIIHEIAHRFFCDLTKTPVYKVVYFTLSSKTSGSVTYQKVDGALRNFLISIGPLILNTLLCMLLTIPAGLKMLLGTDFIEHQSGLMHTIYLVITWAGYSIGFHAIPSNKDVANLEDSSSSLFVKFFFLLIKAVVSVFNIAYIGMFLQAGYAYWISRIIPSFILGSHF